MKRRRINDSMSTLSKPFKSPLIHRQPGESASSKDPATSTISPSPAPVSGATTIATPKSPKIRPSQTSSLSSKSPIGSSPFNTLADPELAALQKQYSSLVSQLSKLKQQLDIAQQAVKLVESNNDAELRGLITKWRSTSREAAEEVFRSAKEKINRMGGVGAWQERINRKPERWEDEDEDDLEDLTDEQKEEVATRKQELADEARKYGLNPPKHAPESDETFTMEMMLRSMNIEPGIIGYDTDLQCWSE